jgi:hypothetical protein
VIGLPQLGVSDCHDNATQQLGHWWDAREYRIMALSLGRRAMTDQVDIKLEALLANVRDLIGSGVSGEEATARKLVIDNRCQELLMTWLRERDVDIQHYREAENALERLREAVKKECDK